MIDSGFYKHFPPASATESDFNLMRELSAEECEGADDE